MIASSAGKRVEDETERTKTLNLWMNKNLEARLADFIHCLKH